MSWQDTPADLDETDGFYDADEYSDEYVASEMEEDVETEAERLALERKPRTENLHVLETYLTYGGAWHPSAGIRELVQNFWDGMIQVRSFHRAHFCVLSCVLLPLTDKVYSVPCCALRLSKYAGTRFIFAVQILVA